VHPVVQRTISSFVRKVSNAFCAAAAFTRRCHILYVSGSLWHSGLLFALGEAQLKVPDETLALQLPGQWLS
jgi:hypothetical protein